MILKNQKQLVTRSEAIYRVLWPQVTACKQKQSDFTESVSDFLWKAPVANCTTLRDIDEEEEVICCDLIWGWWWSSWWRRCLGSHPGMSMCHLCLGSSSGQCSETTEGLNTLKAIKSKGSCTAESAPACQTLGGQLGHRGVSRILSLDSIVIFKKTKCPSVLKLWKT